jgi:hypothetical protein
MKNKLLTLAFIFSFAQNLAAQMPASVSNYNNWFTYFAQYKFGPRWAMHLDAQFRADDQVQRINQSLLRAGAQYFFKPNLNVTLGYAYVNTYTANAFDYFTEHRIWEQLIYSQNFGKTNMTHRLRLEQRFVENLASELGEYFKGHRLRYFNRTIFPLGKKQPPKAAPYLALQNEVFVNFASDDINKNFFDQNRLLVALGILHQKHTRLEIGYMNQFINPASGENVTNHILHFSVLQVLDFGGKD